MGKRTDPNELEQARGKLAEVQGKLQKNLERQGQILAGRRDRKAAEGDILIRANALLEGDLNTVDIQAEAAELEKLHAEETVFRAACQIQAEKVDQLLVEASRSEYERRKPEQEALIRRMISAVSEYQEAFNAYVSLQAEFRAKGLRDMIQPFAWPGLTSATIENLKGAVRFKLQNMGLQAALLKKEGK